MTDDLLTVAQVADRWGVSAWTVAAMTRDGRLPRVRGLGRIRIRAEGEGPYRFTGTKTGETRIVPLPAFVAEVLRVRLEERETERKAAKVWAANEAVFCGPQGNTVPLESLYRWFLGALVRAGLPKMRYHDLRGTTATLLIEMGVDLETVRRVLGHRDIATTVRYVGKTPTALRGAADKLGEAIG